MFERIKHETTTFSRCRLCQYQGDGKLNVMGIFSEIYSFNFPPRHSSMHLVARLSAELGEYGQPRIITVKLLDEDGNQVMDDSGQFQTPKSEKGRKPEVKDNLWRHTK
jgi:hypothetical protein